MRARKLTVGWFHNADFQAVCEPHLDRIRETFFAWPGVLSCRPAPDYTDELRARQIADLRWARERGLELDTLFNCNCYGDEAISSSLADFVSATLRAMDREGLFPEIVTTTSPFIATVLRRDFPSVKIRWSVNLRVHGTIGFESVLELFDSFYVSREHQRDLAALVVFADWARNHGKTLGLQANSGCLRQCPFQTFHDNLHGHGRIRQSEVGEKFDFSVFRCKTNFARGNFEDFLRATWIRPEDLPPYEALVDVVKLATRRHPHPEKIVSAYADYSYDGNLAELMDPVHGFPFVFDNKSFDRAPNWSKTLGCRSANDCTHCGNCADVLNAVTTSARTCR